jgi:hypothetical protein
LIGAFGMVQMGKVGQQGTIEVADVVLWRLLLLWSVVAMG